MTYWVLATVFVVNLVLGGCAWFHSHEKEYAQSADVTMSTALKTALAKVPGQAVEAKLDKEAGRIVYKIDILDRSANTRHVLVDAETGKILKGAANKTVASKEK